MDDLSKLVEYVQNLPTGRITGDNEEQVVHLLFNCWDKFDGSSDTSMSIFKLHRYENLTFIPPATIEFEIERHGATVHGSVYAHVYKWTIDLKENKAICDLIPKGRLVGTRDKPLKEEPLANEIAQQILGMKKDSEFLEWKSDEKVKVKIGKIIPETNLETTAARRKLFRKKLEEILLSHGWCKTSAYNVYEKSDQ